MLLFLFSLVVGVSVQTLAAEDETQYCSGLSGDGSELQARCSYPGYKCSCINNPADPPICHCTRIVSLVTTGPESDSQTDGDKGNSTTGDRGWNPLYVIGIGGSVVLVLLLTSTTCCCLCRQYYARRVSQVKPPDYSDSPPPPYPASRGRSRSSATSDNSNTVTRVREISPSEPGRPGPALLREPSLVMGNPSPTIFLPTYGQGLDLIVEDT